MNHSLAQNMDITLEMLKIIKLWYRYREIIAFIPFSFSISY